jgi:hypothetical protein
MLIGRSPRVIRGSTTIASLPGDPLRFTLFMILPFSFKHLLLARGVQELTVACSK